MKELSQCKVLVVDDTEANIDILLDVLGDEYELIVATNGLEALENVASELPDIILLDIIMPDMDGYEVCRRLKSDEQTKNIPVIFLTAMTDIGDEEKGFALGAVDYITKPISIPKLKARLKSHLTLKLLNDTLKENYRELAEAKLKTDDLYRRLDKEMEKARILHEQTLPRSFPSVEGITFAAYYRPALKLGGDYYHVSHKDNKLIIYLTDVAGHGLDGAMLNVFIKEAINGYIFIKPASLKPRSMLQYLHSRYCGEDYPYDYFVCIFLAVLDLRTMELSYASAGFQSLPLIVRDGRQEVLSSEGPPISAVFHPELADFPENRCVITPGTTLFISTDGLPEQIDPNGQQYGETGRLEAVLNQNSSLPPEQIVKKINNDFNNFISNSDIDDDVTFFILQFQV